MRRIPASDLTPVNHIKVYPRVLQAANCEPDEYGAAMRCYAVEVDGQIVPGVVMGAALTGLDGNEEIQLVTVTLMVGKFETVPFEEWRAVRDRRGNITRIRKDGERFVDTDTAAQLLGITPRRARDIAAGGAYGARKVNRQWWLDRACIVPGP